MRPHMAQRVAVCRDAWTPAGPVYLESGFDPLARDDV
jgi:hypothetical protein